MTDKPITASEKETARIEGAGAIGYMVGLGGVSPDYFKTFFGTQAPEHLKVAFEEGVRRGQKLKADSKKEASTTSPESPESSG